MTRPAIVATICVAPLALPAHAGAPGVFSDQTGNALITAVQSPASGMHSFLAGGAVGDFDRDGFQDIFFAGGGNTPDQLLMNNGDGTFTDEASSWGVALSHRSSAASVADYDNDGWLDIYVTSLGPTSSAQVGQHKLYHNNGNETFTDVAATAGVNQTAPSSPDGWGASWGDYDLDGDLDLAVAGWNGSSNGNRVFRNNGTNEGPVTFTDVTFSIGLNALNGVNGFAPRWADMDGDRYPELIFIGDFGTSKYFINDTDGTFTNFTAGSGTAHDGTEMGVTVLDADDDGDFDFYVTTIGSNNLYINQGNHVYTNEASTAGVANTGWGWGTVAIDFNHDRNVDLVATSQGSGQYAFVNNSIGVTLDFDEVSAAIGIVSPVSGRGLANFNYDNDGDQDLVFFPQGGPVKLFRNDLDLEAVNTNWIRIFADTQGAPGLAPDGIGALVMITINGKRTKQLINGGSNYLSQSELSVHFGLGTETMIDEIRVFWTDGSITLLEDVPANQTLTIAPSIDLPCDGDTNDDGEVNVDDLNNVILDWGTDGTANGGDVTGALPDSEPDGVVDVNDLNAVIVAWGSCP